MSHVLDATAVRRWVDACVRTLEEHREAIDEINVFPVADRDTGTNMLRTMRAALDELIRARPADQHGTDRSDLEIAWSAVASGALAGARGNSGVILSQVLRGLAEVLAAEPADARAALLRADELAGRAVSDPAPGTMLTVMHAAAKAGSHTDGELPEVLDAAARVAEKELAGTSRQLDALAKAGVVDAGAQGLVLVLGELAAVATGTERPIGTVPVAHRVPRDADTLLTSREAGSTEYAYEVMYALHEVDERAADGLRGALREFGDCVSVVGDGALRWVVHVHCNDVGAAIEAGIDIGRPRRIAVVRFDDQVVPAANRFARDRAVVAVVRGDGVAELFRAEGAAVLRLGDQATASAGELVAAIAGTQASSVTVLPNEAGLGAVLDRAAEEAVRAGQDVLVVPTASPVQGLAALAVHDPSRRSGDDAVAMAEAAAATRRGELTVATEEAITWVGPCHPDDVLGLLDGEVVLIEPGPATEEAVTTGALRLLDRMLSAGGELVTALPGAAAPAGLVDALTEHARFEHREVELTGYPGGQEHPILLLGVE